MQADMQAEELLQSLLAQAFGYRSTMILERNYDGDENA